MQELSGWKRVKARLGENTKAKPVTNLRWGVAAGLVLLSTLIASDLPAQESFQRVLGALTRGRRGAVIVSNPSTGELLAVRNPSVAFGKAFPPGSTAKVVEAAALLEERKISPSERIHCRRFPELLGESFHCSHPSVGFPFDVKSALAYSCNYFFAAMSVRLPSDSLAHWYGVFGFGMPVEDQGPGTNPGRVAVPESAEGKARAALGEGTILVTPAQLLLAYSAVATLGKVYRLWTPSGRHPKTTPLLRQLELRTETFHTLRVGLEECVQEGTCRAAGVPSVRVAGKTGTASALDGSGRTHAWFAGYAPVDAPEIALVVFLERGTGAQEAAPLAGEILKRYFAQKKPKP